MVTKSFSTFFRIKKNCPQKERLFALIIKYQSNDPNWGPITWCPFPVTDIIRKVFLFMCLTDERPSKQERDSPLQSRIIRWWWWWWWLSECLIRSNNVRQRNVGNTIEGRSLGNPISGCSESIIGSMHIWGSICYMSKSVGVKVEKIL